ncbi:MAG TPA: alpha/beta hydrolase [Acidimicrobiales bacterium]|jgi:pimeloyl-ACP methyl ester carboxylesterase|nr:alpha/beta hydrolase [Acidimicrobiales bacterium]
MWCEGATESRVRAGDVELAVYEAGTGPLVLLSHGFPELAYSWRHQIPALVQAGYRVIAVDQRGYGRSDRPEPIESYDILALTGDLLAVIDWAGADRAVVVGHGWGAMVAWQMALLHPERVAGVTGMSVPFMPRGPFPPIAPMRQIFADNFFYMVYFQEPGVADKELGSDPARTMRRLLAAPLRAADQPIDLGDFAANDGRGFVERMPEPDQLPPWLSPAELDFYVQEFSRTGFTGGLNWYRNLDRNWELTPQLAGSGVSVPSLFIGGALDPVLAMASPSAAEAWLHDHRGTVIVPDAGHWVQQERAADVNRALLDFIGSIDLGLSA